MGNAYFKHRSLHKYTRVAMGGVKKELTSSYVERGMIYFLKEL